MCWTSRKNTASALSRYANPRFITIWRATRIGIDTNPPGERGPKLARSEVDEQLAAVDEHAEVGDHGGRVFGARVSARVLAARPGASREPPPEVAWPEGKARGLRQRRRYPQRHTSICSGARQCWK